MANMNYSIVVISQRGNCKVPGAELGSVEIAKNILTGRYSYHVLNDLQKPGIDDEKLTSVYRQISNNKLTLVIGSDHTTTAYVFRHLVNKDVKYGCIIFDAHNDYTNDMEDEYYNWNVINKIEALIREGILIGYRDIRKGMPECEKFKYVTDDYFSIYKQRVENQIRNFCIRNQYVYVSIDLDVINPCEFPGTGYKCAGGLFVRELVYLLKIIKQYANKMVIDIVEFNPIVEKETSLLVLSRLISCILE